MQQEAEHQRAYENLRITTESQIKTLEEQIVDQRAYENLRAAAESQIKTLKEQIEDQQHQIVYLTKISALPGESVLSFSI